MKLPPDISGAKAIKALERRSFAITRHTGSHADEARTRLFHSGLHLSIATEKPLQWFTRGATWPRHVHLHETNRCTNFVIVSALSKGQPVTHNWRAFSPSCVARTIPISSVRNRSVVTTSDDPVPNLLHHFPHMTPPFTPAFPAVCSARKEE